MQCINPVRLFKNLSPLEFPDGLLVPCGKCIACRISKRREWSIRMLHELEDHEKSVFVTLTYSDDYLPQNESLKKEDLQKFMKRLRKSLEKSERKIRYFACGEYGDKTERPHYHLIIYGLGLNIEDRSLIMDAWPYCDWSNRVIRNKSFGLVEPDSVRYVAQYIDKKYSGEKANVEYTQKCREPCFKCSSLGIGKNWCDKNKEQVIQQQKLTFKGIPMQLPRYYMNRLGITTDQMKSISIEKDMHIVEKYTGVSDITRDEFYRYASVDEVLELENAIKSAKIQNGKNLTAKSNLKTKKL